MRLIRAAYLCLLALFVVITYSPLSIAAETTGSQSSLTSTMGNQTGSVILAVGDQLAITVRDHTDLSLSEAVRPDGKIGYPILQTVQVAGLTADQVRAEITRRLGEWIQNPDVTVIVVAYHNESIYVVGSVRSFGPFPYAKGMSAQEAVQLAGGWEVGADATHTNIIRDHKIIATLDLSAPGTTPFLLKSGDMVYVPKRPVQTFTIVGAVARAGTMPLLPNERILDAITQTASPTDTSGVNGSTTGPPDADLSHITLTRGPKVLTINGQALLQGDISNNIALEPGDVIFVPTASRITVVGSVQRPGTQSYQANEKILDAITQAGVLTPSVDANGTGSSNTLAPDLEHTTLTRAGKVQIVDVAAVLAGDMDKNILLHPGDVIYVPSGSSITVVGAVQHPGAQPLLPNLTVLAAATAAGINPSSGFTLVATGTAESSSSSPDLQHTTLTRNGKTTVINLDAILKGDMAQNANLEAGDVLYIPVLHGVVTVLGQVVHPQTAALTPGARILDLINLAGGLTPGADGKRVTLKRLGQPDMTIDYNAVLEGKNTSQNVLLEDGDVVTVPVNPMQVMVLGDVAHPGIFPYKSNDGVLSAIVASGGSTQQAALDSVSLIRYNKDGTPEHYRIDVKQMVKEANFRTDKKLQAGDIIYVPDRKQNVSMLATLIPLFSVISSFKYLVPGAF